MFYQIHLTSSVLDGVGILFRWGEVEEWLVLITMSIPPVWPIFRPFTHRFIKSTITGSKRKSYMYNYKQPYSTTAVGDQSPGFPPPRSPGFPPMVTTTISISSAKDGGSTIVPSETGSRVSNERVPHDILHDKSYSTTWVELSDVNPKDSQHQP
jgi:hypothetical protein